MRIAREGYREILLATLILCVLEILAVWLWWPLSLPVTVLWLWVVLFFRDPPRAAHLAAGELCAPADGTVTEVSDLEAYEGIDGPAIRIGMFLSLFNVHINRMPCTGRVREVRYARGSFLDARHRESGLRNESNTLTLDPAPPMPGPVIVRQVAGRVARRIVCHARAGDRFLTGERFGMIKFGSRTELIVPFRDGTQVQVRVGDRVKAGLTVVARQAVAERASPAEAEMASLGSR